MTATTTRETTDDSVRTITYAEWTAALRSGAYPKGKGYLCQLKCDPAQPDQPGVPHYCVWGVALDLMDPNRWSPGTALIGTREWWGSETIPPRTMNPPVPTPTMVGYFQPSGNPARNDRETELLAATRTHAERNRRWPDLTIVNDYWTDSFDDVADLIDLINDPESPLRWSESLAEALHPEREETTE